MCCACHGIDTASIYCPLSWGDQTSLHGCFGTLLCSHALILTKWFVASSKPDRANLHPYAGNIFILNGLLSNCLWCIDVAYLPTIAIFLADNRKEVAMIQAWACHTHSACPIFFALFNSTMSITTETSKIICSLFYFHAQKPSSITRLLTIKQSTNDKERKFTSGEGTKTLRGSLTVGLELWWFTFHLCLSINDDSVGWYTSCLLLLCSSISSMDSSQPCQSAAWRSHVMNNIPED